MDFLIILVLAIVAFVVSDAFPVINMHGLKGYIERLKGNPNWRDF